MRDTLSAGAKLALKRQADAAAPSGKVSGKLAMTDEELIDLYNERIGQSGTYAQQSGFRVIQTEVADGWGAALARAWNKLWHIMHGNSSLPSLTTYASAYSSDGPRFWYSATPNIDFELLTPYSVPSEDFLEHSHAYMGIFEATNGGSSTSTVLITKHGSGESGRRAAMCFYSASQMRCALVGCDALCRAGFDYCSKTHAVEGFSLVLSAQGVDTPVCNTVGCEKSCFVHGSGCVENFCGRSCATRTYTAARAAGELDALSARLGVAREHVHLVSPLLGALPDAMHLVSPPLGALLDASGSALVCVPVPRSECG